MVSEGGASTWLGAWPLPWDRCVYGSFKIPAAPCDRRLIDARDWRKKWFPFSFSSHFFNGGHCGPNWDELFQFEKTLLSFSPFPEGQIFSSLFVKADRVDTDCSCTLIKNFSFFFCLFVLMMWCECRCFGPPPRRDWMYNISRSLNIHGLPTLVWEKRQAKKRREKSSRVCECDSLLSANSQKISLRCFSRHLVSVTKAGKKGESFLKRSKPHRRPLCLAAAHCRSPGGFNWLFSSCHSCDPPHY